MYNNVYIILRGITRKRSKQMKRKVFAVILSVMLVMCMMPVTAFAEGEEPVLAPDQAEVTADLQDETPEAASEDLQAQDEETEETAEQGEAEELQEPEVQESEVQEVPEETQAEEDAETASEEAVQDAPEADVQEPEVQEPEVQEEALPEQEETAEPEEAAEPEETEEGSQEAEIAEPTGNYDASQVISKLQGENKSGSNGVIVYYKEGAVSDRSLTKSQKNAISSMSISKKFGQVMTGISGSRSSASNTLYDQKKILDKAVGSYTVKDTFVFGAAKTKAAPAEQKAVISLISSDKYSDEELADILEDQDSILYAEPNTRCYALGTGSGTTDPYLDHAWQIPAMNARSEAIQNAMTDDEVIVAIVDTGVNYDHEELADSMWINDQSKTGLAGTYGYDFVYDDDDPMDENGHGSHCAGIIAAQMKNDLGTAGVAGKANVKIMALRFLDEEGGGDLYDALAAYCYIIRALDAGVQVRAINNSWGAAMSSAMFEKVTDIAGEKGALSFFAAGNESADNDVSLSSPANVLSPYGVTIDSLNEDMELASYSSYGKKNTDICSPGTNIVSSVSYDNYTPYLYTKEKLQETTAYYGEFDDSTVLDGYKITPTTGTDVNGSANGDSVKAFGESVTLYNLTGGSEATMDMELVDRSSFNGEDNSKALKWTINNPSNGDMFLLFFPYNKEAGIMVNSSYLDISYRSETDGMYTGIFQFGDVGYDGEIGEDGLTASMDEMPFYLQDPEAMSFLNIADRSMNDIWRGAGSFARRSTYTNNLTNYGVGIMYKAETTDSVSFYIDSIGVAKKNADPESFGQYDLYSGTSMATPAAVGAAAILASIYPDADALTLKGALLSMAHTTDALSPVCSTGGYLDLSNFDPSSPGPALMDATVNFKKETITLTGKNLGSNPGTIYCETYSGDSFEVPAGNTTWAGDKVTITKAGSIIGRDVTFTVTTASGKTARGDFYTVKGERLFPKLGYTTQMTVPPEEGFDFFADGEKNKLSKDASDEEILQYFDSLITMPTCLTKPVIGGEMPYFSDNIGNLMFLDETPAEDGEDYSDGDGMAVGSLAAGSSAVDYSQYLDPEDDAYFMNTWYFEDVTTAITSKARYQKWAQLETVTGASTDPVVTALTNAVAVGSKIYEYVRFSLKGNTYDCLVSFNPEADENQWSIVWDSFDKTTTVPSGITAGASLALLNGRLYLIGGYNGSADSLDGAILSDVYSMNLSASTLQWTKRKSLPVPAAGGTAITQNGKIYYVLGYINGENMGMPYAYPLSNPIIQYFDGSSWKVDEDTVLPAPVREAYDVNASVGIRKDGIVFTGLSTDGGGDAFVYKTDEDLQPSQRIQQLNYTMNGAPIENTGFGTSVGDQQYFIYEDLDLQTYDIISVVYKFPLGSSAYSYIGTSKSGLGSGTITGAGTYTLGDTAKIKITPKKNSFIKKVLVDGEPVTVTRSGMVLSVKATEEYHDVEVVFGSYDISKSSITLGTKVYAYNGKAKTPSVKVRLNGVTLTKGTHYTVTYKNNVGFGTASAVIKGAGNYTGSKTVTFKIIPAKVLNLKLTAQSKAMKVSYSKVAGNVKYQIAYRVKGTSKWSYKYTTATSATVSGLTGGKTYEVKVRAYYKGKTKTVYGNFNVTKTVTVKK